MKKRILLLLLFLALCLLPACGGKKVGEACTWKGDGFTASHDCGFGSFCLRSVDCPLSSEKSGTSVSYGKCVSSKCKEDKDCENSFLCVVYSSSASYCVPKTICE